MFQQSFRNFVQKWDNMSRLSLSLKKNLETSVPHASLGMPETKMAAAEWSFVSFYNYFKLNINELRSRDGVQNEDKVAVSSAAACSRDGSFP